jgi:hypothetical protein
MRENNFQTKLIQDLRTLFPGCVILKNDANYLQGFPDLTILYRNHWAVLECKRSFDEPYRPNQEYYLNKLNDMSFAFMICPENREEILDELQSSFKSRRTARVSISV